MENTIAATEKEYRQEKNRLWFGIVKKNSDQGVETMVGIRVAPVKDLTDRL